MKPAWSTIRLGLVLALAAPAQAQCLSDVLLPASTPRRHGGSCATSNGQVICTDTFLDAYFFERLPSGGWAETARFSVGQQTVVPSGATAMEGPWAAVGYPAGGGVAGEVTVFGNGPGGWAPISTIIASDSTAWAEFGWDVDISGDRLFTSAPHLLVGNGESTAYVFERTGTTWLEVQRMQPSDMVPGVGFGFGTSLDADGDTLVVGAFANGGGGAAYVFERGPTAWVEVQKLFAPDGDDGDDFGWQVAVSGDTILVGAPSAGAPQTGAAYVYERSQGTWSFAGQLPPPANSNQSRFGEQLTIQGDRAIVAGTNAGSGRGRVRVFGRVGSEWHTLATFWAPDEQTGQYFGRSVLDGPVALIGAPGLVIPSGGVGALYEFGLGPAESPTACSPTPNSTGEPARLLAYGCPELSAADLTLAAGPLPAEAPAVMAFGAPGLPEPFFDGTLCIRGSIYRLATAQADANGVLTVDVDFATPPGDLLTAGTTWTFQGVYRDPLGGPGGVNLTAALSLTLEP